MQVMLCVIPAVFAKCVGRAPERVSPAEYACYYTRNQRGQILLLVIYAKSVRASIPGAVLKQIKEVMDHAD